VVAYHDYLIKFLFERDESVRFGRLACLINDQLVELGPFLGDSLNGTSGESRSLDVHFIHDLVFNFLVVSAFVAGTHFRFHDFIEFF
jgi:hypothetical protein